MKMFTKSTRRDGSIGFYQNKLLIRINRRKKSKHQRKTDLQRIAMSTAIIMLLLFSMACTILCVGAMHIESPGISSNNATTEDTAHNTVVDVLPMPSTIKNIITTMELPLIDKFLINNYPTNEEVSSNLNLVQDIEDQNIEGDTSINSEVPIEENPTDNIESMVPDKFKDIPLEDELKEYIYFVAIENNIPAEIMFSLAWKESAYTPSAVSKTNDFGLFQINKCNFQRLAKHFGITYSEFCEKIYDPYFNTLCSVYILTECRDNYNNDNWHHVLMRYNMGPGGASKAMKAGNYSSQYSRAILDHAREVFGLVEISL